MLVRRVLFPDTVPWVRARAIETVELEDVVAHVASRLPNVQSFTGDVIVQVRNDSGPTLDILKVERYGVNVYARTRNGAGWRRDDVKASDLARKLQSDMVAAGNVPPVTSVTGGAGPYEVALEEDALDAFSHYYFTVELTVRGVRR